MMLNHLQISFSFSQVLIISKSQEIFLNEKKLGFMVNEFKTFFQFKLLRRFDYFFSSNTVSLATQCSSKDYIFTIWTVYGDALLFPSLLKLSSLPPPFMVYSMFSATKKLSSYFINELWISPKNCVHQHWNYPYRSNRHCQKISLLISESFKMRRLPLVSHHVFHSWIVSTLHNQYRPPPLWLW